MIKSFFEWFYYFFDSLSYSFKTFVENFINVNEIAIQGFFMFFAFLLFVIVSSFFIFILFYDTKIFNLIKSKLKGDKK